MKQELDWEFGDMDSESFHDMTFSSESDEMEHLKPNKKRVLEDDNTPPASKRHKSSYEASNMSFASDTVSDIGDITVTSDGFQCRYCDETFEFKGERQNHQAKYHKNEKVCRYCKKDFPFSHYLTKHISNMHRPVSIDDHNVSTPRFKPSQYNNGFANNRSEAVTSDMTNHVDSDTVPLPRYEMTFNDQLPFQCRLCDHSFKFKGQRLNHTSRYHKDQTVCGYCKLKSRSRVNLDSHIKYNHRSQNVTNDMTTTAATPSPTNDIHGSDTRDVTTVSNLSYDLKKESMTYDDKLQYQCRYCNERFEFQGERQNHQAKFHKGQKVCGFCKQAFNNSGNLISHVNNMHRPVITSDHVAKINLNPSNTTSNEKLEFQCRYCEESFAFKGERHNHTAKYHKGQRDCGYCKQTFKNHSYLANHVKNMHRDGMAPREESKVQDSHSSVMTDLKPTYGMTKSENKLQFACRYCDRSFEYKGERQNHQERYHKGQTVCGYCKHKSRISANLVSHVQVVHHAVSVQCEICKRILGNVEYLKKHMKSMHGNDIKVAKGPLRAPKFSNDMSDIHDSNDDNAMKGKAVTDGGNVSREPVITETTTLSKDNDTHDEISAESKASKMYEALMKEIDDSSKMKEHLNRTLPTAKKQQRKTKIEVEQKDNFDVTPDMSDDEIGDFE